MSPGLVKREHAHRRLLLLGLSSLLLLSILPTVAHHTPGGLEEPLGNVEHLGAFCAAALRILLTPVHGAFHLALAVGFAYALWDRMTAWWCLRSVLGALESHRPDDNTPLAVAAERAGLDREWIRVVCGLANPAFTAGLLTPRIYVSSALSIHLSQDELNCVVAHEAAHLRQRDPLRLSTYRFLSCLLFWLPALRSLASDFADEAEIQADTVAGRETPLALAAAILQLATLPQSTFASPSVVRFANPDLLDRRIRRLTGENTPLPTRLNRQSLSFATIAIALVIFSGFAATEPQSNGNHGHDTHCDHHHGSLWSHMWCSPGDCHGSTGHCEHAG